MWRKTVLVLIAAILVLPAAASGQLKEKQSPPHFSRLLTAGAQPRGLIGWLGLNPARFSMQQTYSLSYLSYGGRAFSQGIYLNTMEYQPADPLRLQVRWGLAHQPFAGAGIPGIYGSGLFFSGANVEYRPSSKVRIGLSFDSYPPGWLSPYLYDSRLRDDRE